MIRVVTYNVSFGLDLGAAAQVLATLKPDVACLLEVPGPAKARWLARRAGLVVAARSGRRAPTTAILTQPGVRRLAASRVPLTVPRDIPARQATHVIVGVEGARLSVTAVQLGLRPEVRATNLRELLEFVASVDAPSIIGADLNESVRSPVAAELASRYQDAQVVAGRGDGATYPATDPSMRQDFVFVDRSLVVHQAFTATAPPVASASHHRPVVADFGIPAGRGGSAGGERAGEAP